MSRMLDIARLLFPSLRETAVNTGPSALGALSIPELCDRRDTIEAELHRRALATRDAIRSAVSSEPEARRNSYVGWHAGFAVDRLGEMSATALSDDRSHVKVVFFRDFDGFRTRGDPKVDPSRSFSGHHGISELSLGGRSYGPVEILPLDVYEGGAPAILALAETQAAKGAIERERDERAQYEQLKAKFGS